MVAFMAAVDAGVHMVELDVHLTKDEEVVVIHDDTVNRTTNGKGPVAKQSLAQLKKLDAGTWFHPRFVGERIPTLTEVLRALAPRVRINIEIKSDFDRGDRDSGMVETVVMDLINREDAMASVIISSFDGNIIRNVARIRGAPPVAFISQTFSGKETVDLCRDLNAFSFHPNYRCLDKKLVDLCHAESIVVFPYNVNTDREYERSLQLGVDGVIVDDPAGFNQWYLQSKRT